MTTTSLSDLTRLSPSRLRLWLKCRRAWWFHYVAGFRRDSGAAANVGTAIHAAIETCAKMRWDDPFAYPEKASQSEILGALPHNVTDEERVAATAICRRLGTVTLGPLLEAPELEINHVESMGIDSKCFIDLIREDVEGTIEVVDWKTGQNVMTYDEAWADPQTGLYLIWAHHRWHDRRVVFRLAYIGAGQARVIPWSEDLEAYHRSVAENAVKEWRTIGDVKNADDVPASVGSACSTCDHRDKCSAIAAIDDEAPAGNPGELDLAELLSESRRVSELSKAVEARKKDLYGEVERRMGEEKRIEVEGIYALRKSRNNERIPARRLVEFSAALGVGVDVVIGALRDDALSRSRAEKLVKDIGSDVGVVDDHVESIPSSWVEVRERKRKKSK